MMNDNEIFSWGMKVEQEKSQNRGLPGISGNLTLPRLSIDTLAKINEAFNQRTYVRCRVCHGNLGCNPDCSYCEHKMDEARGGFL